MDKKEHQPACPKDSHKIKTKQTKTSLSWNKQTQDWYQTNNASLKWHKQTQNKHDKNKYDEQV